MQDPAESTGGERLRRLSSCGTLAGLPRAELEWLAANGRLVRYDRGEMMIGTGQVIVDLFIVLAGHLAIDVDRGAGPRRVMEWKQGAIGGLLPYSRMRGSPGDNFAQEPTEMLAIPRDRFTAMTVECPEFTALCVHTMLDRARNFNSSDLHDEKMLSLGRLAAGLAHELNNPASAAVRGARLLSEHLPAFDDAARELGAVGLAEAERVLAERVRGVCLTTPVTAVLSPIERADREDRLTAWLEAHGLDPAHAGVLAETAIDLAALDDLAAGVRPDSLDEVIAWIAAGCTLRALALDVEKAAKRIHDLVGIVKKFTYMDRLAGPEPVDVGEGLRDTLAMVAAKARARSEAVSTGIEPGLPRVMATGGELNQVWLNLIDNALDAVPEGGHVRVTAETKLDWVVVRVIDDGPGVPDAVRERIFDPFFTTKAPGQGTGLGLDIARRLVRRYDGDIELDSGPGRTEFRVRLPAERAEAAASS